MDTIAAFEDAETGKVIGPTFDAFVPLLASNRNAFLSTRKATFQYGRTPRHMMDIYYPDPALMPAKHDAPVLFFFYGGGLSTGERTFAPPYDVLYSNLGWYFTQKGIVTIVSDYRLVPQVQFPSSAEDVYKAVRWAIDNREHIVNAGGPDVQYKFNFEGIFLMAHGSGVLHLSTALMLPGLLTGDHETRDRIAGAVFVAGTYGVKGLSQTDVVAGILAQYWGTYEALVKNSPQALLESASKDLLAALPEILIVEGEREPDWLMVGTREFQKRLAERRKKKELVVVVDGHNHISVQLSPGSGQGEEWVEAVIKWMKNVLDNRLYIIF
ncbi:Alpha/Beta hydrolase fold [Amanita muscaria]